MALSEYRLIEALRVDGEFVLYRGQRILDQAPVLVLVPGLDHPAPTSLARLEHEYAIRGELEPEWAVRPLALARHAGRTMLVLDDPGGKILVPRQGRRLKMTRFLRLAIGLTAALGRMHARGLIHKDIKPANVLADTASGIVWLTGFGIASQLSRERQTPEPPEIIAGTLAYMAPEQTGRMNRSIDARSDLYALGVTLYELLTGALPFTAADPMEWVHCHIARPPMPPAERTKEAPEALSRIIMKLLAKTAEERYQTAAGVEADLRRCLAEWEARGGIDPFPLGAHDAADRLIIPETLYGRESEIQALLAAFERVVAHGTPELALVSGYSGVGKSSVVNELQRALIPARALFASGKFDQYKRDIPYATLAQALQTLVRQLLSRSEAELGSWRDALREAVAPNGQLLVDLIPELVLVIGEQPPVADLPPREAQSRFHAVFRRFLGTFARPDHPLVLFLDDLQWLDAATLDLLEHLISTPDLRHLLLIGAYRDNEVAPSHPLMLTLDAIRRAGASVHEIVLPPLSAADVGRLVVDALHCAPARARPLARLLYEKTAGNPFFTIEFLTELYEEHLLEFDPAEGAWRWDVARIHAKGFSDNVVDLMVGKLRRLPAATQDALKQLACLGNSAASATLTMVRGQSAEATQADLWEAVRVGLVLYLHGRYRFLHDRVQEAAYALIPEEERAAAHLRIGRLLTSQMTADEIADGIFDVVNQLNRGCALIADRDEKERLAAFELLAGKKAKASTAYVSARSYLAIGMDLMGGDGWASRYELAFGLALERAECEFLSGDFEAAERLIAELLEKAASKTDKAAAYRLEMDLHVMKSEHPQAVASALECLRLLGIEMPAHPTREEVQLEYEAVWRNLAGAPIESLVDLPLMTDPGMQAAMRVLSVLFSAAFVTDVNLLYLHLCRMVNVSLAHGTTDASSHGYAWFGLILGPVFHRYEDGYRFGKLAVDLIEKHGFGAYKAKAYFSRELVDLWTQPITTAIDFARAALRAAIETGDLAIACYSCHHIVVNRLLRGDHLDDVWGESEKFLDFIRKARFRDVGDNIVIRQRLIRNMQGRTVSFSTFSDAGFDEAAFEAQLNQNRMSPVACRYWIIKLQARFIFGDYEAALEAAEKAKSVLWAVVAHIQTLDYHYYAALAIAAAYEPGQSQRLAALTEHVGQLREWAESCSATFRDKHLLVAAEVARIEGRDLEAMRRYDQAIGSAHENGFIHNEAIAYERASAFYQRSGFDQLAETYLRKARACYAAWGAAGKVRQLEERHPQLREALALAPGSAFAAGAGQLDLISVVKASQAISREIVEDQLLERLMRIVIENAGAQRGCLLLVRGEQLVVVAEAGVEQQGATVRLSRAQDPSRTDLPASCCNYVWRSGERLILAHDTAPHQFATDPYFSRRQPKSILCLPVLHQARTVGVLYLENSLATQAFTPKRVAVLELLAAQAAISLQNARLYAELQDENSQRKRAEEALRQSEERFRDYAETASDWFWETGPDHRFTNVSERAAEFGHDIAVLIGRRRWDLTVDAAEESEKWQRHRDTLARHEPFRGMTYMVLPADGKLRYVSASGKPVFDPTGRFLGYRGGASDVTESVLANEAIRQATQQKMAAEAERRALLEQIVEVQEQERLRIARELHDQMGQDLTGLSLSLKTLDRVVDDEGGRTTLRWLQSLTVQMAANLHRIATELRPTALDDVGLIRAVETYLAEWSERFDIRTDFHARNLDDSMVPSPVETTAYRVIQEALTNILKHAQARTVSIVMECREAQLQVIIEDDGKGFDPTAPVPQGRLGLSGMRERLALVGGILMVDSATALGTTLYIRIPLVPADQNGKRAV